MLPLLAFLFLAQVAPASTTIGGDAAAVLRAAGKTAAKAEVLRFHPGSSLDRQSFAVVYERKSNQTYEALIDLTSHHLPSWKNIPGVQPSFLEEYAAILKAVRADPCFAEIVRRHGATDLSHIGIGAGRTDTATIFSTKTRPSDYRRSVRAARFKRNV